MSNLNFLLEDPIERSKPQPLPPYKLVEGDRVEIVDNPAHARHLTGKRGIILASTTKSRDEQYCRVRFDDVDEVRDTAFYYKHVRHIPDE